MASPAAPTYGAGQIMVVAAWENLGWRRDVELAFVSRHPGFVASTALLPIDKINDPDAIFGRLRQDSVIAGVLLLGPKGAGLSQSFVANQYYVGTVEKPWANTSATLFDEYEAKVIWQADASTGGNAYASWSDIRSSFVGKILNQLRQDNILVDGPPHFRAPSRSTTQVSASSTWVREAPKDDEVISIGLADLHPETNVSSTLDRVRPAVVTVEGDNGIGTAFIISRTGLAITNHHVVAGQTGLRARFQDSHTAPLRVIRSDRQADVALIEIDCSNACKTVPLKLQGTYPTGTDIYALGNPAGLSATVTKGIVSGTRRANGVTLIQVDAALNPGNSGGPIVSIADGQALAVVSFKLSSFEGLGFGVALDDALRILGVRFE